MWSGVVASAGLGNALCFFPLTKASWATACMFERVERMAATALPVCFPVGLPTAFGAVDVVVYFFHAKTTFEVLVGVKQ